MQRIGLPCNARDFHPEESQTSEQMGNTHLLWEPVLLHPASSPAVSATSTAVCGTEVAQARDLLLCLRGARRITENTP